MLIYTGRKPLPDAPVDVLIRSWGAYAPPRFVRAVAARRIVDGSPDRSRLLPSIYRQEWTGADDRKHEIGGTLATLKRVLFPPWPIAKGEARRPWLVGRFYVAGRGHRRDGRLFACPVDEFDGMTAELREKCRAVRFEITHHVLKPDVPGRAEVLRTTQSIDIGCPGLSTSAADDGWTPPWMVSTPAESASSSHAPPDGGADHATHRQDSCRQAAIAASRVAFT